LRKVIDVVEKFSRMHTWGEDTTWQTDWLIRLGVGGSGSEWAIHGSSVMPK